MARQEEKREKERKRKKEKEKEKKKSKAKMSPRKVRKKEGRLVDGALPREVLYQGISSITATLHASKQRRREPIFLPPCPTLELELTLLHGPSSSPSCGVRPRRHRDWTVNTPQLVIGERSAELA
ncbi:PREDICTED: actin-binding protein F-like [Charadrius vociferus]|uniref:actin-binding protein F-like n=1 Tax=Charadrius vociferus TaxID=50402 RepID=UPI00052123B9|nr:PREDICTED: actin-binding protein F-like [Charadrius vociferus]